MKKRIVSAVMGVVMAVGMLSGECFAAGSQTRTVEVVLDSSSGTVNGEAVEVEIVATNTDMNSTNDFTVVSVPEEVQPVYNYVINQSRENVSAAEILEGVRSENPDTTINVVSRHVDEEGNLVTEEADEELNAYLETASSLTAPFELYPRYKDGDVIDELDEAKTVLKVLELQALYELNKDNQELLDSIRLECWVTLEDGSVEVQVIKPVSIDLEKGHIELELGNLVPCMATILYDKELAILE